ncbi:hypothetical protein H920_07350 [Fukomys damarensis]|uniref:Uncharacterized protein n=1 Tax=Fukomys damarensis TaxID=885580 RepID=A0A091DLC6_FUKDA|nr:hypothetical protein H920_07350 [Fukomys damarensis]
MAEVIKQATAPRPRSLGLQGRQVSQRGPAGTLWVGLLQCRAQNSPVYKEGRDTGFSFVFTHLCFSSYYLAPEAPAVPGGGRPYVYCNVIFNIDADRVGDRDLQEVRDDKPEEAGQLGSRLELQWVERGLEPGSRDPRGRDQVEELGVRTGLEEGRSCFFLTCAQSRFLTPLDG